MLKWEEEFRREEEEEEDELMRATGSGFPRWKEGARVDERACVVDLAGGRGDEDVDP